MGMTFVFACIKQSIGQLDYRMNERLYQSSWQSIQQLRHLTQNPKCQRHGGTRGNVRGSPKSLGFIVWGAGLGASVI